METADDPVPPSGRQSVNWKRASEMMAVVVGVVGLLLACNELFPQVLNPPKPAATNDAVRLIPAGPSTAAAAASQGWPDAPLSLRNDFVSVTARVAPEDSCQGNTGWVTPNLPTDLPFDAQIKEGARAWAVANGAVLNSGNFIELTVQVQNDHRVTVNAIGVKTEKVSPPLKGFRPNLSGGCGAEVPATFQVNIDTNVTTSIEGQDQSGRPIEPIPLPHTLNEQDKEGVWKIKIVTEECDCEFVPYFSYTTGDGTARNFDMKLSGDKPWRVTASSDAQPLIRSSESGVWSPR